MGKVYLFTAILAVFLLIELACIVGIFLGSNIATGIFAIITVLNIRAVIVLHRKGQL